MPIRAASPSAPASREAYEHAYACDPVSAFGGIIAFNHPLDAETAAQILERQFVEVVIAPSVDDAALAAFAKKPNVRVLATGEWPEQSGQSVDYKRIAGGMLAQDADRDTLMLTDLKVVSKRVPNADELRDLLFAWHVSMYVKSNAIVYARESRTIGIGAGQMSRVISARIAAIKAEEAGLSVPGSVMASDAFFPFRDGIDTAAAGRHPRGHPARRLDARQRSDRRRRRTRHGHGVYRRAAFPALARCASDGIRDSGLGFDGHAGTCGDSSPDRSPSHRCGRDLPS